MEEVNIFDQAYMSSNKKHEWKRREVALFLLGSFAEDISMFRIRNPSYDLKKVVSAVIVNVNFEKAQLKSMLKGRTLWCANQLVEILPRDYEEIHTAVLNLSTEILTKENLISLKLVATRSLIKFSRKLKPELL